MSSESRYSSGKKKRKISTKDTQESYNVTKKEKRKKCGGPLSTWNCEFKSQTNVLNLISSTTGLSLEKEQPKKYVNHPTMVGIFDWFTHRPLSYTQKRTRFCSSP